MSRIKCGLYCKYEDDSISYLYCPLDKQPEGYDEVARNKEMRKAARVTVLFAMDGSCLNDDLDSSTRVLKSALGKDVSKTVRSYTFTTYGKISVHPIDDVDDAKTFNPLFEPMHFSTRGGRRPKRSAESTPVSSSEDADDESEGEAVAVSPSSSEPQMVQNFEFANGAKILVEGISTPNLTDKDILISLGGLIGAINDGEVRHRTPAPVIKIFKAMCTINSLADEIHCDPVGIYKAMALFSKN
jgi:hypothetical protein